MKVWLMSSKWEGGEVEEAKTLVVSQDARDICVHLGEIFCTPGQTEAKGDWIYLKSVRHDSCNAEAP